MFVVMKNKKRVLFVSPSALNNGGVQYVLMSIVRNFSNDYIFDIIVFNNEQNYYKEEFLSYGGNIYYVPKNEGKKLMKKVVFWLKNKITLTKKCRKIFLENKYDIVHCCNGFDSPTVIKTAKKFGIPVRIIHCHGSYKKTNFLREIIRFILKKKMYKYSTNLVSCSKKAGATFFDRKSHFSIIYAPILDNIVFSETKPDKLTLCQIGLYCNNKNQSFSLEVTYELLKLINCNIKFVGIGDNTNLVKKAKELNISKNVIFLPSNYDKNELFSSSSYFIFPSFSEGCPISVTEAQKAGLHCFVSDTVTDEIDCGGVEFVSLSNGPKYWARKIFDNFLANNGEKFIYDCSRFNKQAFLQDINNLYLMNEKNEL